MLFRSAPRPISIEITGLRPGEKVHETLLGSEETSNRPAHPKVSHVNVTGLDLRGLVDLPTGPVTAADIARIASTATPADRAATGGA